MPESSAKAKYDIEYAKTKLKRVPLDVQKEKQRITIIIHERMCYYAITTA